MNILPKIIETIFSIMVVIFFIYIVIMALGEMIPPLDDFLQKITEKFNSNKDRE